MLNIDKNSAVPVYEQIYRQLKEQIIEGELPSGSRLSATRTLAADYHISRNTVLTAYQQLESEGFIYSKVGSGFYVEDLPEIDNSAARETIQSETEDEDHDVRYDFRYGNIEPNIYGTRSFRKALKDALSELELKTSLSDSDPRGYLSLRQALAEHLLKVRGVVASVDQIIITCGHHYSLKMISEFFPREEYRFIMEEPGHQDTREVFLSAGYHIDPIRLDENGIQVNRLSRTRKALAYVTPSHQFPLGYILPFSRRIKLLEWAEETDSYIIEDDYDSELRYKERPIPSLHSLDRNDRVIYLGSFSKSLSPDLRISYIVFPRKMKIEQLAVHPLLNSSSPALIQLTLEKYLRSGEYLKRINQVRNSFRRKHNLIIDFLKKNYPEQIKIYGSGGGTHFILELDTKMSQKQLIERFRKNDVGVYPTKGFWADQTQSHENRIMIGYAGIPEDQIEEYLERLKTVIDEVFS